MDYKTFERLIIFIADLATLGTVLLVSFPPPDVIEVFAQVLLLFIIVAAVHYGPRGGAFASMGAVVFYVVMRSPTIASGEVIETSIIQLIALRAALFGGVGIIGGEFCSRMKYFLKRLEGQDVIDSATNLYNKHHFLSLLGTYCQRYERYHAPFSVLHIDLDEAITELKASDREHIAKQVGTMIRRDVRAVDEVGRMGEFDFELILPHTEADGAKVAMARLRSDITKALQRNYPEIDKRSEFEVLAYPQEREAILEMLPEDARPKPVPASRV